MGPKDHMQKKSYLTRSLYYPWGERKNLKGMNEAAIHRTKSLHIKEDNIVHMGVGRDKWYQHQGRLSSKGAGKALGAKSPISLK